MRIVMETRDGPRDVTATPADVSDRHHRSNGRGVVCLRWQTRYNTANAVLCTLE